MSVKDLISAAFNKDASSFESTLHSIMQEKMGAAIQARFSPAIQEEEVDLEEAKASKKDDEEDDDEDEMCEESEQIDELSKKTLGSYIKKASQHSADVAHEMGKKRADRDDIARFTNRHMSDKQKVRDELEKTLGADVDTERANRKLFNKRSSGIDRAVDKLSK
jgi:hypothetical protein